jgi:hypothetical protein
MIITRIFFPLESEYQPSYMASIVPAILLHFLHTWRADAGSTENAGAIFSRPTRMQEVRKMQEQFSAELIIY